MYLFKRFSKKQIDIFGRSQPFVLHSLNHCIYVKYNVIISNKTNLIYDTRGYSLINTAHDDVSALAYSCIFSSNDIGEQINGL